MNRRWILVWVATLLVAGSGLAAQTIEEQTIRSAYNYLAIGDYERAYSFINFVLKLNAGEEPDPEVRNLAESIYFNYLSSLLNSQDFVTYDAVRMDLAAYPQVNSIRIQQLIEQSEARIAYEREAQNEEEIRRQESEEEQRRIDGEVRLRELEILQQQALNDQRIELQRLEVEELVRRGDLLSADLEYRAAAAVQSQEQQQEFNEALLTIVATGSEDQGLGTGLIVVLAAVGLIVLFGFVMLALMFIRNSQQQERMFEYTVSHVNHPRELISIPMYTAPITHGSQLIEHQPDRKLLPGAQPDIDSLKTLMQKCREIAAEIDDRTRRKNSTRNVAELVYKIATYDGYDEYECMLFMAAGLVYDIGFLALDESLFDAKQLNEEQFETLKTHTTLGTTRIGFVPEEYKPMFIAGILKHHENLDGSGYPEGAAGDDIPYIARVIRAAESYIAMTSHREFREIRNKSDAVDVLMAETHRYDSRILTAITDVV